MNDQERIITLRRAGFDNHTVAAMVGVETQDVRDALAGTEELPAVGGGGGGLPVYGMTTAGAIGAGALIDNTGSRPGSEDKPFSLAVPVTLTCDPGESAEVSLLIWTMDNEQGYTVDNVKLTVTGGASQVQQRTRLHAVVPSGYYAQVTVNESGGTALVGNAPYVELA